MQSRDTVLFVRDEINLHSVERIAVGMSFVPIILINQDIDCLREAPTKLWERLRRPDLFDFFAQIPSVALHRIKVLRDL